MNFDHFTANELVDALDNVEMVNIDRSKLIKLVYRQIRMLESKKYLKKSDEKRARSTIYFKSPTFDNQIFVPNPCKLSSKGKVASDCDNHCLKSFFYLLSKEKIELEAEKAITLREMDKYRELLNRYPQERDFIKPFYSDAREQATNIQGSLEAVKKLLQHYPTNANVCD